MALKQTRGDTRQYYFKRLDNEGHAITTTPEGLYFTVKQSFECPRPLFQKTLNNMAMDEDGTWRFTVEAADTNKLPYGNYVYDIEVVDDGAVTTISKGKFILTGESTWAINEV